MFFRFLLMCAPVAAPIGVYIYHWLKKLAAYLRPGAVSLRHRAALLVGTVLLTVATAGFFFLPGLLLLHFWAFSALAELAVWLLKKLWRRRPAVPPALRAVYRLSLLPALCVALVALYGAYNMGHIVETRYTYETDKSIRPEGYRVVLITDVHYGSVQDTRVLKRAVEQINAARADLIVLGGDIVEENTSREEMEEVFGLLGALDSPLGVYYVYGNHDAQPYTDTRAYTRPELARAITENGVCILEDAYTAVGDDILLVGRSNAAWGNVLPRPSVDDVLGAADRDKLILVADHQPVEAEQNGAAGADIQLSGHTHAGQIWPAGLLTTLSGALNYGRYQRGGCTVFVSSGAAGWSYPIRTGEHCEYVVLDILPRT